MHKIPDRSLTNLLLVALVLAVAGISCARIGELTKGSSQSDKVRKLNSELPAGVKNAEDVRLDGSSFVIILGDLNEIYLNDPDSQPISADALYEKVAGYLAATPRYDARIYIKASIHRDSRTFAALLNDLRKHDIDTVSLLAHSRAPDEVAADFMDGKDIPEPDRVFQVNLRAEVYERPNPLTLVVSRRTEFPEVELNSESFRNQEELREKLDQIFRAREMNGVFREGTNEVEQSVWLKLDGRLKAYAYIITLIDTLKAARARPIVLIDDEKQWQVPKTRAESDDIFQIDANKPDTPPKRKPKTISGGVLNGKAVNLPKPPYPPAARAVRASGSVQVQVTVDPDGNVVSASALSGHPLLRNAAVQAARSAKFAPTLLGGDRVSVTGVLTYNFSSDTQ
jgi:TonB family protein